MLFSRRLFISCRAFHIDTPCGCVVENLRMYCGAIGRNPFWVNPVNPV